MNFGGSRFRDEPEISLTSLIDVVFTLIIFFVVTTTFDQRSAIKLELPEASSAPQTASADPLMLVIDAEGRYFVGSNEVLRKDGVGLRTALAELLGENTDASRPVTLRADARTPHQAVVTALDALGQLGFEKVSIATVESAQP
jgi:biopolymer transport protein ExbD